MHRATRQPRQEQPRQRRAARATPRDKLLANRHASSPLSQTTGFSRPTFRHVDLRQCAGNIRAPPVTTGHFARGARHFRGMVMKGAVSDLVVGLLMAVLGLVGLILAAGAVDDEIYIFGLGLAGLAVLFDIGIIKAHFDRAEAARQAAKGGQRQ
jgi:hypothetical protein